MAGQLMQICADATAGEVRSTYQAEIRRRRRRRSRAVAGAVRRRDGWREEICLAPKEEAMLSTAGINAWEHQLRLALAPGGGQLRST